jgi:cellobiose phosphorylase
LYQSGGAIGFRDQLQDVISIADLFPDLARKQIIEAAEHQYIEGDVMHWWHRGMHGESDKGVRTKCSDDLVWLVWAACEVSIITGNNGIFDEKASWIVSQPLGADDVDRYENAVTTEEKSTIYEHCIRAIVLVQKRGVGSNGLLKIGGGDWNDGFNRLGSKGNGESVWLTFFAAKAARSLSEAAAILRRVSDSDELIKLAEEWGKAADEAWSNDRYLRGTYDDGKLLGAVGDAECAIDSVAQSAAVLSGFGSRDKCNIALDTALRELCDIKNGVIKLFTPPFDGEKDPGYIRSYIPGVRENGGRYTHAAIWLAMALFKLGRNDEGAAILDSLLPADDNDRYKIEPFVIAADVYSDPQNYARGGWSWYTGSAGWFRRAVREYLLPSLEKSKESVDDQNNACAHLP